MSNSVSYNLDSDSSQYVENLKIRVVYDNNQYIEDLKTAWGFSCYIKGTEKNILFDTGGDGITLIENMEKMEVSPDDIDIVFLSHIHGDHVGGLGSIVAENPDITVFVPESFPGNFKQEIQESVRELVEIDDSQSICDCCYSTGELGTWIKEQSLIISTDRGIIIITGCAHPGIAAIVKHSKELMQEDVLFVMGGFHLSGYSEKEINNLILSFKDMGVVYAGPCHCSGDNARRLFEQKYGSNYINIGAGRKIELKDLQR